MNGQDFKNSILQLAIQGKLVEQREEEGTAKQLIENIKAEKEQLIRDGKIRKEKPFSKIDEGEIPYNVPENWQWVRFGDLGSFKKGPFGSALTKSMFVPKSEDTVKVYEQKNAIQKNVNIGDYYITREYFESKMKGFELSSGDIIVSCAGTIGETYIIPDNFEQGIINQALMQMKLMPSVYVDYFLLYFDFILKKTARKSSKGSAIKNIPPFKVLKNYVVPLPPLEEQKRIVAKIEELMPYVEEYDKAYTEVTELNKKFPEDMQKSILQYAIQGKLVEQREEEGTAEELYQQIHDEKKKLIEEGKIKKTKALPEITEEEIPFDIPESWKWVRFQEVCEYIQRGKSPKYSEQKQYPVVAQKCNQWSGFSLDKAKFIDPKTISSYQEERFLIDGDLMWNSTGLGTLGRVAIYEESKNPYELAVADSHVTVIRPLKQYVIYKYMYYYIANPTVQKVIEEQSSGSTKQIELSTNTVKSYLLPLPPLGEQKRIVHEIEEMLPYTKQLIK
ncbi:restriction endonuclease subunit S [Virgibacillus phasianinus]|uniref:Restriction endonuclease subunit S n=1 Tax=Virgibacillus phasianinus TaxID=2017483 RepID=A0A220U0U0_9BACI|nr:restriction endonuclease subunit S [Virgibacillus phasianinus]ASK61592.1 restriction endonuclease subunit S [Virgibacillus phasianinus]